jgi:hypothetical protein
MNAGSQILLNALSPDQLVDLLRPMIREEIRQALSDQEENLLSPAETCKLFKRSMYRQPDGYFIVSPKSWREQKSCRSIGS